MEISESYLDEEWTLTMIEDIGDIDRALDDQPLQVPSFEECADISKTDRAVDDQPIHVPSSEECLLDADNVTPSMHSKQVEDNTEAILKKSEAALAKLNTLDGLEELVTLQSRSHYLVSQEKLVDLVGSTCSELSDGRICGVEFNFHTKVVGCSLELSWRCQSGHSRKWVTSETLPSNKRGTISLNDAMLASAVIISGNNYAKLSLLCQALGMQIISESSLLRFQKHCAAPVIEEIWSERNDLVKQIFKDCEGISLCGDARNDSPGNSAKYCEYTLVEHFTRAVMHRSLGTPAGKSRPQAAANRKGSCRQPSIQSQGQIVEPSPGQRATEVRSLLRSLFQKCRGRCSCADGECRIQSPGPLYKSQRCEVCRVFQAQPEDLYQHCQWSKNRCLNQLPCLCPAFAELYRLAKYTGTMPTQEANRHLWEVKETLCALAQCGATA